MEFSGIAWNLTEWNFLGWVWNLDGIFWKAKNVLIGAGKFHSGFTGARRKISFSDAFKFSLYISQTKPENIMHACTDEAVLVFMPA